jgi:predicted PurR-regulated permease PerM
MSGPPFGKLPKDTLPGGAFDGGPPTPGRPELSMAVLFHFTAFAVLIGWLLVIGRAIVLPLVVSVMLTYVLVGAARALRNTRVFAAAPSWVSYVTVLVIAGLSLGLIVLVAVANLRQIALSAPQSEAEILATVGRITTMLGFTGMPTWETLRSITVDRMDLPALSLSLLSSVAAIGGYLVLILTYVAFMVAERGPLQRRIDMILPDGPERGAARAVFDRINAQIVSYLSTKTLINAVLGGISYVLMLLAGVENAVFWAFMIALLNYIPYVGSLLGVGIVVLYVLLIGNDLDQVLLVAALLTAAQVYVGNWLEPRVMSRSLDLSPLVVLVALVVWSSLWGLAGAIIAVPMTSILLIVLSSFEGTRFIPVLLSSAGRQ